MSANVATNINVEVSSSPSSDSPRITSALRSFFKKLKTNSTSGPPLPTPPPATQSYSTALDAFFGAEALEAHRPYSAATSTFDPPPYAPYGHEIIETAPGIYAVQEPPTLAQMLFWYGFVFFPFWIVGIFILFCPLRPTEDWEAGKTEDEKAKLLVVLRDTETKWAHRCLYAMCTLFLVISLITLTTKFGVMHSR